ncbi:hypothetical protein M8C21_002366, partial [Ambrosia artemisiifolia]
MKEDGVCIGRALRDFYWLYSFVIKFPPNNVADVDRRKSTYCIDWIHI